MNWNFTGDKMSNCKDCEGFKECLEVFNVIKKCDVLFVQDCSKIQFGVNGFKPETIKSLSRSMPKLFAAKKVNYLNLVNVFIENYSPSKEDIKECQDFILKAIEKAQPDFIVALGSTVFKALTGKEGFKNWVGRCIEMEKYKIIPVYHPDFLNTKIKEREAGTFLNNCEQTILNGNIKTSNCNYTLITDHKEILECLDYLRNGLKDYEQSFDYETTHLDPRRGELVCINISYMENQGYCLYFFDREIYRQEKINPLFTRNIYNSLGSWMKSPIKKICHQAKFEIKWTMHHLNCEPENVIWCTKQAAHLLDENSQRGLKDLAYQLTDMGGYDIPMQQFLDGGKEHWEAPPDFMLPYAAGDSDCTLRVKNRQYEVLNKDKKLMWLFKNITMPTVYTLARIENRGMKIDVDKAQIVKKDLTLLLQDEIKNINSFPETKEALKRINENKKERDKQDILNLNSTPQMSVLLFDVCKLPVNKKSKKTKNPSTDINVLTDLKDSHPIVESILSARGYTHQLSELEQIFDNLWEGYISTDFVQDYVVTGRLSSRNPNLQNVTGGTEEDPALVKSCYISRFKGGSITQADYNQLELRLVGSESNELKFINAFREGVDLHSLTASELFKIPYAEVIKHKETLYKKQRALGKKLNFSCVYNITEHGLSKQLRISKKEALEKLEAFWTVYSTVEKWFKSIEEEVSYNLQTRAVTGRIRRLPEAASMDSFKRERALRQGCNFKIQNPGAEMTLWSMNLIDLLLRNGRLKSIVIGQVHDSILVDTYPGEESIIDQIIIGVMETKANKTFTFLRIPMKVTIDRGDTWMDLKSVYK